jgi:hypothetical protein
MQSYSNDKINESFGKKDMQIRIIRVSYISVYFYGRTMITRDLNITFQ